MLDEQEGDWIAASIGDADIICMCNPGAIVVGASIAEAWGCLYYPERACDVQRLAQATGRKLLRRQPNWRRGPTVGCGWTIAYPRGRILKMRSASSTRNRLTFITKLQP